MTPIAIELLAEDFVPDLAKLVLLHFVSARVITSTQAVVVLHLLLSEQHLTSPFKRKIIPIQIV